MRSTSISSLVAAIISVTSAHALESGMTARSSLSTSELWSKVSDFCAISAWDPIVERCDLSADGKQRTILIFGVGSVVAELDDWDNANRSYSWRNVSGLAPVSNYRGTLSVIADGQASALKVTARYEAKGVSDAEAQKIIDGAIFRALCINGPLLCSDDRSPLAPAEVVGFDGLLSARSHSLCAVIFDVRREQVPFRLSCCCMGAMARPSVLIAFGEQEYQVGDTSH